MTFSLTKTILFLTTLLLGLTACQKVPLQTSRAADRQTSTRPKETYGPPQVIAQLKEPDIDESSGLAASRTAGVYWTHNDSGDGPFIYAVDDRGGGRGIWLVAGAAARDWEDIAAGPGPKRNQRYLYIGDIGDNGGRRSEIVVYRIPEPSFAPADVLSTKSKPRLTEPAEAIRLHYPDGKHNAETLLVHPVTGDLYVISKTAFAKPVVYKASAPLSSGRVITLVRKAELDVPSIIGGLITGGGISPNGRRLALCDYFQGYELVLSPTNRTFDDIWKQPILVIDLGARKQGEAIAYRLDGKALLATSEGVHSPLIQVVRQ